MPCIRVLGSFRPMLLSLTSCHHTSLRLRCDHGAALVLVKIIAVIVVSTAGIFE